MTRLTEDDPITSQKIVDKNGTYNIFNDPFTNYCPDCEGCGYSNYGDEEEYPIDFRLETCTRCNGSGELQNEITK